MERHDSIPTGAVEGWQSREVSHPAGERIAFHHHRAEEWLEVLRGGIRFFTLGERELPAAASQAVHIAPGEVHRAEIGPEGVSYRMWMPRSEDDPWFTHRVGDEMLALLRENLTLPEVENRWEARNRAAPSPTDREDEAFLRALLSAALTFRTAKGGFLDRGRYLARPPPAQPVVRSSRGTVQVLHASAESVLLSTVVETRAPDGTGAAFENARLFVREDGRWKCRVWWNTAAPGGV
jgi:hypothetical protein